MTYIHRLILRITPPWKSFENYLLPFSSAIQPWTRRQNNNIRLLPDNKTPFRIRKPPKAYPLKKEYFCINLDQLDAKFNDGETVDKASLIAKGFISAKSATLVKVLGNGDVSKKLNIVVDKISESAKAKIEKAGGSVKTTETAEDGNK